MSRAHERFVCDPLRRRAAMDVELRNPIGAIPASFIFGALIVGANSLQRAMQVPAALITALNGLVVVFVVSSDIFSRRLARSRQIGTEVQAASPPTSSRPPALGIEGEASQ